MTRQGAESSGVQGARSKRKAGALVVGAVTAALLIYLGIRGGGYEQIVRDQVGLLAWWVLAIGCLAGLLPVSRPSRGAWTLLGLLLALAAWTAVGALNSPSAERGAIELARVLSLSGIFALAVFCIPARSAPKVVAGVATAVSAIGLLALTSRFEPSWFRDAAETVLVLGKQASRLGYPLDYWNGLAALIAMGVPLLLAGSIGFKSRIAAAAACGVVPALALASYYTLSRGGVLAALVALAVLFALHPRRLALAVPTALAGVGSIVLIALAQARPELTAAGTEGPVGSQPLQMAVLTLVVCAAVAAGLVIAGRTGLLGRLWSARIPETRRRYLAIGAAVVGVIAIAVVVPRALDAWSEFKQAATPASDAERFQSFSGSGRYQWWTSAADAGDSEPLIGIGPGTFEYWWAENGTVSAFVRDAHSLYLEAYGELGVLGLLLVLGLVLTPLTLGSRAALRGDPDKRTTAAAATAGIASFAVAAAIDWAWELTILPVAFLLLSAALLASDGDAAKGGGLLRWPGRAAIAVVGALAVVVIAIPLATAGLLADAEDELARGDAEAALRSGSRAADLEPYASEPYLVRARAYESLGELRSAAASARMAIAEEPGNWRAWFLLARIERGRGRYEAELAAWRRAHALNPRSSIVMSVEPDPPVRPDKSKRDAKPR